MKLVRINPYDASIQALLQASEPRRAMTVGNESPRSLTGVDYFLLAFMGVTGFVLGRHLKWEATR